VTNPPEILETVRLRLRKPVLQDAEEIFRKYARDPEVTRYLTRWPNASVDETRDFIRRHHKAWDEGKSFHWVIVRKEDDQLLGTITARVTDHKWELGFVLARSCWDRGYMTGAVKGVVDWALKQQGIYRVWSICDVDNVGSARVMEKVGMQKEGVLRRWSVHPSISPEPRDAYWYAITK